MISGKLGSILIAVFLVSISVPKVLCAEKFTEHVIDEMLLLDFEPVDAYFLLPIKNRGNFKVKAEIVRLGDFAGARSRWLFGAWISLPKGNKSFEYSLIVHSKSGKAAFVPSVRITLSNDLLYSGNNDSLNEHILESRAEIRSLSEQIKDVQGQTFTDSSDVDGVDGQMQVMDVNREKLRYKSKIMEYRVEKKYLERMIEVVRSHPTPPRFKRRENELGSDMVLLARQVRKIEEGEEMRGRRVTEELERRFKAIEDTRGEDIAMLREKLAVFQDERARAERYLNISSSQNDGLRSRAE